MKNEPVAWMELYFGEPNNLAWDNTELKDSGDVYKTIPLYTHPAKTLTISDRDILKIIHDKFTKFGFEADYIVEDTELIEFARTILRKAQEK